VFIAIDSLKFYKLKNENTVRILFLIVYVLILLSYVVPIGEILTVEYLTESIQDNPKDWLSQIRISHLTYFLSTIFLSLITVFISIVYANCLVMEKEGFPSKKAVLTSIRRLPQLLLFFLLLLLPVVISGLFLFIPLIFLYYSLFFVPLLITEGRRPIVMAIRESYQLTRGFRLSIFTIQVMLYFILNIPMSLVIATFLAAGSEKTLPEYLLMSFFRAAQILITGRMMGIFYFLLAKRSDKKRNMYFQFFNPNHPDYVESNSDVRGKDEEQEESEEHEEHNENSKS
jgi:hypothetical protein